MITLWLTFLLCRSLSRRFSVRVADMSLGLCQRFSMHRNVRNKAAASVFSASFPFYALGSNSTNNSLKWPLSNSLVLSSVFPEPPPAFPHLAVLDVYVLSTDGQVQDFKFPQSSKGGVSIQLSANTVKLNSRNGKLSLLNTAEEKGRRRREMVVLTLRAMKCLFSVWETGKCKHVCLTFAPILVSVKRQRVCLY